MLRACQLRLTTSGTHVLREATTASRLWSRDGLGRRSPLFNCAKASNWCDGSDSIQMCPIYIIVRCGDGMEIRIEHPSIGQPRLVARDLLDRREEQDYLRRRFVLEKRKHNLDGRSPAREPTNQRPKAIADSRPQTVALITSTQYCHVSSCETGRFRDLSLRFQPSFGFKRKILS